MSHDGTSGDDPGPAPGAAPRSRRIDAGIPLPVVSVRRLMLRFFLTGLAGLVILAAATAFASRRVGTDRAASEAQRIAYITASGIVQHEVTPALMRGDPAALQRVDEVIRRDVLRGSLVRTKIWAADGRIVYSDEARLIGERFTLDDDAKRVMAGGEAHAEISDLSKPENRFERPGDRLLEVYAPLSSPSGTPLLFEVYFSYGDVTAAGRSLWLAFAPVVLGALLLLQLLQLPSAWSMARRLRRGQDERELLLQHAIQSSDAERRRIAGDLHDGSVQDLVGVSFALSAALRRSGAPGGPPIDPKVVETAAEHVRGVITALRSLLVEIYPPNLEEEGLGSALADMVAGLSSRGITPHVDVTVPAGELRPHTTGLIYRTAQELVRNTLRHSGASGISIHVATVGDRVRLTVEDDGRGFDPRTIHRAQAEGHVGLRGLGDLVAEAGGTLEVESAPGKGTMVTVEVPK
ncbi:MAG: sensor histidine kinase [Thermoleophilia bacterium]